MQISMAGISNLRKYKAVLFPKTSLHFQIKDYRGKGTTIWIYSAKKYLLVKKDDKNI